MSLFIGSNPLGTDGLLLQKILEQTIFSEGYFENSLLAKGRVILKSKGMFLGDFIGGFPKSEKCKYYDFDQSSEYEGEFKFWSRHGRGKLTWHG